MSVDKSPGELELDVLIRAMEPVLYDDIYVFATVDNTLDLSTLNPLMIYKEEEGITLILTESQAIAAGIEYEFACKKITLNIHSSLDAVGFLARISTRLAALQMGVNPVSGFYHDHLFIPKDKATVAMQELKLMSSELSN